MIAISPILRLAARLVTFAIFVCTLISAFSGYIPPVYWSAPSVAVLVFPYLFIATAVAGVLWLLCRKYLMTVMAVVILIVCMPVAKDAVPFNFPDTPSVGKNTFTLLTYNILHGIDNEKGEDSPGYSRSLSYVINSGADIVCIQELYALSESETPAATKAQFDSIRRIYPFIISRKGLSMFLLSKYPAVFGHVEKNVPGNIVTYHLKIKGRTVELINVHLTSYELTSKERKVISDLAEIHPRSSATHFKQALSGKLLKAFKKRSEDADALRSLIDNALPNLIVCGDFNDVPASWAYRKIKGKDLSDARAQTSFGPGITYNDHYFYFQLDQILYRGDFKAIQTDIGSLKASDHYPVKVTFEFIPSKNK